MAPPASMERALTSSGVNSTCGPIIETEAQRALVMLVIWNDVHFFIVEHVVQGGVAGGAVVSEICHAAPNGSHFTHPGVSCGTVADRFDFDSVLLVSE